MADPQGKHRIFVVDDEPAIAFSLGEVLRRQGFEVTSFTDPLKALEAIHINTPDFLIADVVMPGMSGIELAIVIREAYPTCMVLLFSGQLAISQMLQAAKESGHDFEVLSKPVPPEQILAKVFNGLGLNSPTPAARSGHQISSPDQPDYPIESLD